MLKRVLVVDDELSNRISIGTLLEQFGFDVTHSTSGADAISIYEKDPTYDLVILSVDMANGLNGFGTAKLIRQYQRAKRPYVVGVSSQVIPPEKILGTGMDFVLTKPLEAMKLNNLFSFPLKMVSP